MKKFLGQILQRKKSVSLEESPYPGRPNTGVNKTMVCLEIDYDSIYADNGIRFRKKCGGCRPGAVRDSRGRRKKQTILGPKSRYQKAKSHHNWGDQTVPEEPARKKEGGGHNSCNTS